MHRHLALQVRQVERGLTVATVDRADDRKQRVEVRDWHRLPVAEGPVDRRELETEAADFADETALLAEPALAEDWSRPEEDAAWAQLQPPAK